ncbi:hydrolase [Oscillatoriales cyanobacterium USR001]|nr:hydrolase [Oscillatoriales cyanobacterium USR001]
MQNLAASSPNTADIQLLALDIDGTIAGASNDITETVKQAILAAQTKGINVVLATGRMYRSALRFHQAIGSNLPLICYQGAWIQDPATGKILSHLAINKEKAIALLDYLEQPEWRSLLSVHCYINDRLYVREILESTKNYAQRSKIQPIPVGNLRSFLDTEPTKILAMCDDPEAIANLLNNLRQIYSPDELYLTRSVPTFFEATNPLVNKGAAIRYIAEEILGLQPANVMAIGDNFNDVEMIDYAGIGVAMGDGPEEVKAIAQWVAPNIDQDGAAAAIEKFLL